MTFIAPTLSMSPANLQAMRSLSVSDIIGLNARFGVTIDGMDLGRWGQCKGLGVDFKPDHLTQGGVYDYEVLLPGQMTYKAVSLRRAVDAADSAKVQAWLAQAVQNWVHATDAGIGGTAVVTLFSSEGAPVISWTLRNVYPSKWDGPELDAASAGIAMETLELVHEGFL